MNKQIEALETSAGQAGDLLMAAICQVALYGEVLAATSAALDEPERAKVCSFTRQTARAECERVIAANAA